MKCRSAKENEIKEIKKVLTEAKSVTYSENFLDDFPFQSTEWFNCNLNKESLGNLYLFWDGCAWGESKDVPPRMLKVGVEDFKRIAGDPNKENPHHLQNILKNMKKYTKTGNSLKGSGECPILISIDKAKPLLILDGNHRFVAYWWKSSEVDQNRVDKNIWIGFSPDLNNYKYYSRVPSNSSD